MEETSLKAIMASIGSVVTSLFVTPLEVIKTRQQVEVAPHANVKAPPAWQHPALDLPKRTSTFRTMTRIITEEGPLALYAGMPPTLIIAIPSSAMYFVMYETLLARAKELFPDRQAAYLAIYCGSITRAVTVTVFSPIELVRVRMQASAIAKDQSFVQHFRQACRGGTTVLFRGLGATLARDIPFSAVYWCVVESVKQKLNERLQMQSASRQRITVALLGALAGGSIATVVTHPFDLIKTRRQAFASELPITRSNCLSSSICVLRSITRQEGIEGLAAGLVPRLVRIAPACGIMLSTYEAGKAFLNIT